jgi:hypothetical protein
LLLVDPPLDDVLIGPSNDAKSFAVASEPYQGGYQDFIPYDDITQACSTPAPPRTSILEDICHYWEHHYQLVNIESDKPVLSTVFLQKIAASNYMLLTEYLRSLANELGWRLSRDLNQMNIPGLEEGWSDLQSWMPRCSEYGDMVESILLLGDIIKGQRVGSTVAHWTDCLEDFCLIQKNLIKLKSRADAHVASFMGLAGIAGNRQSLNEARSVHILTVLGTFFIPLSFCTGLFSMSSGYLPGEGRFWIYLTLAMPLAFLICLVALYYDVKHGNG